MGYFNFRDQITSALDHVRARVRGRVNPERIIYDSMNKVDSTRYEKPNFGIREDGYEESEEYLSTEYDHLQKYQDYKKIINSPILKENTTTEEQKRLLKIISNSTWNNPYIRSAIPTILLTIYNIKNTRVDNLALKNKFVNEINRFQNDLFQAKNEEIDIFNLSYMLCSFVDEKLTAQGFNNDDVSLLVKFHKDSWGGEVCFEHLENYLRDFNINKNIDIDKYKDILGFYDLLLSLGFKGKYAVINNGLILLNDLRNKLNNILFPTRVNDLTYLMATQSDIRKRGFFTPLNLFLLFLGLFLLIYLILSIYLHLLSRNLRNEILAWNPPVLSTILDVPPPELARILQEGWLQIEDHPQGWLLIFTSDGAFDTGSAELTEEFKSKRNIERVGNALSSYPGDLEVIGHTDSQPFRTKLRNNLQLSIDRAKTVAKALEEGTKINDSIKRSITYTGKGESEPRDTNQTAEGRKKNRRVDILWKITNKTKDEVKRILNEQN